MVNESNIKLHIPKFEQGKDISMNVPKEASYKEEKNNTITIIDNRTNKKYTLEIENNTIRGTDQYKIKENKIGQRYFDPGYMNTVSSKSAITFIDGDKGILQYRGYPIEQLAGKFSYLTICFLLQYGELPTNKQLDYFSRRIMSHTRIHTDIKKQIQGFRYDVHPMAILITVISSLGGYHPEANPSYMGEDVYKSQTHRNKQIHRIIGTIGTISAYIYCHRMGRPFLEPKQTQSFTENFLYLIDAMNTINYTPNKVLIQVFDILFILHADHEFNCSTSAMRHIASSDADVYTCLSASIAALYGPKHGGANEAVVRMLQRIGSKENIQSFIDGVKKKRYKLMGFGHRVYKNYDPRAAIIKKLSNTVFSLVGKDPLIDIAVELERIALNDKYFIERKLYPNVDFYSGIIYKALGFPVDFYPVLFAIGRTVGWLAHWLECLDDHDTKIVRPQQMFVGSSRRSVPSDLPTTSRGNDPMVVVNPFTHKPVTICSDISYQTKRRNVALTSNL